MAKYANFFYVSENVVAKLRRILSLKRMAQIKIIRLHSREFIPRKFDIATNQPISNKSLSITEQKTHNDETHGRINFYHTTHYLYFLTVGPWQIAPTHKTHFTKRI